LLLAARRLLQGHNLISSICALQGLKYGGPARLQKLMKGILEDLLSKVVSAVPTDTLATNGRGQCLCVP
jgi:hypothetical protein